MTELAQENTAESQGGLLGDMPSHDAASSEVVDPATHDMGADAAPVAAEGETHASTEAASSAGMPQLNPASYPSQLFWLGVTFIAMYVLMSRSVLPRIADVLEKRRARREGDLALADQLTREAEEAKASYEKLYAEAKNKANTLIADAEAAVRASDEQESAALDKTLVEKMQKAEASIRASRAEVVERLAPVVSDVAAEVVKSIAGKAPTDAQLKAAAKDNSWK